MNAIGCHEFLATVHQDARFFQGLHWEPLEKSCHGIDIPHVKMRADLNYYQPAARVV